MSQKKDRDRRMVAKGATLFTSNTQKKSVKRKFSDKKYTHQPSKIKLKQIIDPNNEGAVIKKLESAGIEVNAYKKRYLMRRIKARMSKLNLNSYKGYLEVLNKSKKEITELHESLSINVTRFFRNRDTFETIRDEILPALVKNARVNNRSEIKIWSAGCAVGAEPYSLAMIASDVVPSSVNVRIFASDIKDELINIARFATYSDQYVAEMHPFEINSYFNMNEHGEYIVKPHIKKMVSFSNIDLMKDSYPTGIDLILCRNVLIYIEKESQKKIISNFFRSIRENGMVILGRTETLFVDWRKHIKIISTKHRIYQKIGDTPDEMPSLDFQNTRTITKRKPVTTSHQKRLDELKNFRKTYEDRRKSWEERIKTRSSKSNVLNASDRRFAKNRIIEPNKVSRDKYKAREPKSRKSISHSTSRSGGLSNYRDSLKRSPRSISSLNNLVGSKSPEEVYRELKKRRSKRKK